MKVQWKILRLQLYFDSFNLNIPWDYSEACFNFVYIFFNSVKIIYLLPLLAKKETTGFLTYAGH